MKTILLFLSYCIDFQARNFERQQLVQLDPKEIKTQILERLKTLKAKNQTLKHKNKQSKKSNTTNKNHKRLKSSKQEIRFKNPTQAN
ncbi:hypothetical protein JT111_07440 [Helicobacter pylori]|nr:hypothetical protein [Helicobacter pylori]